MVLGRIDDTGLAGTVSTNRTVNRLIPSVSPTQSPNLTYTLFPRDAYGHDRGCPVDSAEVHSFRAHGENSRLFPHRPQKPYTTIPR